MFRVACAIACLSAMSAAPCRAQENPFSILGSWQATVTATSLPGNPSFTSLITFVPNGGVVETRRLYVPPTQSPTGAVLQTPGAGRWDWRDGSHVRVAFKFLLEGAPDNAALAGQPLGTDNIRWEPTFNPFAQTLVGPWRSEVIDEGGNVIATFNGQITAGRLAVPQF